MTATEDWRRDERRQLRQLELAAIVEGTTLLLLVGIAMPLKYVTGSADAVHIMGPGHGLAFVAYCWVAVQSVAGGGWTRSEAMRLFLGALLPFGGLFNLAFLSRKAARLR